MSTEAMSIERQVEIMETQLSNFTGVMEKLTYLHNISGLLTELCVVICVENIPEVLANDNKE